LLYSIVEPDLVRQSLENLAASGKLSVGGLMTYLARRCLAPCAILASLALSGCKSKPAVCDAPQGGAADVQGLAQADTAFALAFYPPAAAAAGGQNVILSPYSVSSTLKMLDVGAAGETDTQIRTVIGVPGGGAAAAPGYAALACTDETDGSSNDNQLSIANALWGQTGMPFQPSFLSVLASGYEAPLQQVDFTGDAAGATDTINGWVSGRTQGKIPQLFMPGDLDGNTRLVLANAMYFNGVWASGFSPSATSMQPFTLGDGTMVSVPTMQGTVSVAQGVSQGFVVIELPYKGGTMVMDFLLPGGALADLEASLTADGLRGALAGLGLPSKVVLHLPKFSFSTRVVLNPVLAGLGMPDAFDMGKADLSGIDGNKDLYVALVVQQAFVEVDEQGTVAAAATGASVSLKTETQGPPDVLIDQPFLFLVRDTGTGSLLFMGRVGDPRAGS
jgi:serpin B